MDMNARISLGSAFAAAEAAGRRLSYEEAMVEVRGWLENPNTAPNHSP